MTFLQREQLEFRENVKGLFGFVFGVVPFFLFLAVIFFGGLLGGLWLLLQLVR